MRQLTTEQTNPNTIDIDALTTLEIVYRMNAEDNRIADAVARESEFIAKAVDVIASRLSSGGRLMYLGAGTSGRLGVLDASECPPTFNTPPELVLGIIAGGPKALTSAIEGAEDCEQAAIEDLQERTFCKRDVLVGIASSGRTPYVLSGLRYAKQLGAAAIGVTCNRDSELLLVADIVIAPIVGPEVISGSTRLKAGTATKMVLNMLTTATMVKLGKTFGNWMVDLRASNVKLKARSIRIVAAIAGISEIEAEKQLELSGGEVKTAIVASKRSVPPDTARMLIGAAAGKLRQALEMSLVDPS